MYQHILKLAACQTRWAAAAAVLVLSACGGGAHPQADTLPEAPVSQAATGLATASRYPAAVAVQVSADDIKVSVAGVARVGGAALRADDAMPLGSITKSMTATLAGLLVQDGQLGWDSRLLDLLPELRATARAEYQSVTLRDLLAHRSGLYSGTSLESTVTLPAFAGDAPAQRLAFVAWALSRAPEVAPGSGFAYSNGGYVAVAAMLERVTGGRYEQLMQERLFQPLGIRASFGAPGCCSASEALGHLLTEDSRWLPLDPALGQAQFPAFAYPAGAVKTNGAGLGRFLQMHLRALQGRPGELLTPATARALHAPDQDGVALGWLKGQDPANRALSWHDGSDDISYFALQALDATRDRAGAVLVNGYKASVGEDGAAALAGLLRNPVWSGSSQTGWTATADLLTGVAE